MNSKMFQAISQRFYFSSFFAPLRLERSEREKVIFAINKDFQAVQPNLTVFGLSLRLCVLSEAGVR